MDIILKYTLKKIQEQTSLIPYLNEGGCCHFAKLLAKELEFRNINYKITLCDSYLDLNEVKQMIKKRIINSFSVAHVYLKIGKYFVDGINTSVNTTDFNINKSFKLSYKDLKHYSNNSDWNPWFNRKKYHSIINKIITNQFKIYDKLNEQ